MAKRTKDSKEITFSSLPETIQKALVLLWRERKFAIGGVGFHTPYACPIACAYGVVAGYWGSISRPKKTHLVNKGWTFGTYNSFIKWYDMVDRDGKSLALIERTRSERSRFLSKFLKRKTLPKTAA